MKRRRGRGIEKKKEEHHAEKERCRHCPDGQHGFNITGNVNIRGRDRQRREILCGRREQDCFLCWKDLIKFTSVQRTTKSRHLSVGARNGAEAALLRLLPFGREKNIILKSKQIHCLCRLYPQYVLIMDLYVGFSSRLALFKGIVEPKLKIHPSASHHDADDIFSSGLCLR